MAAIHTTLCQRLGIKGPGEERSVGGRQAGVQTTRPVHMPWIPNRPGRGTDLEGTSAIDAHRMFREGVRGRGGGGLNRLFRMGGWEEGKELEVLG